MLTRLKIENIAIIELADINFFDGFNVLTGETGAGKSIIIDSINAVTGERTSKELIRTGASGGKVTAVFENPGKAALNKLEEMGIECDGTVIISRTIKKDGKNICSINGMPCTVSMLKSVGTLLINIHGQHDSQSLLQPENHCSFIDAFGENEELLGEYRECYESLLKINAEINSLDIDEQQKARRIDMLKYQINELESASITVGEMDTLTQRHAMLRNSQAIIDGLSAAYEALTGEGGGCDSLNDASYELESAASLYDGINSVSERITDAKYEIEDCVEEIRSLMEAAECDPEELDSVEERIDFLRRMMSKYGSTEQKMLEFLDEARKELDTITLSDEKAAQLKSEREELYKKAKSLAKKLSQRRKDAGEKLSQKICAELEFLDMPNVMFGVSQYDKPLSYDGADEIEFLISPNAGEEKKPLAKIASGGELSRVMLAIKNVLSDKNSCDTMIFDEIDTGVSGSAARKIGLKLKEVSEGRQVICVTHLAQIAAMAQSHMLISKYVADEKTYTRVELLDYDGRLSELARIMGAGDKSSAFLKSAAELLESGGHKA